MDRLFKYKIDHILFWLLTVFFHGYTHADLIAKAGWLQFVLELVVRNGLLALVIYSSLLWVVPKFIKQKNYLSGTLLVLAYLLGYVLLKNAHDVYLHGYVMENALRQTFFHNSLYNLSIVIFYLAFATTLYLSKQWYLQKEQIRKIEIENLNTELAYLKSQINPHFLFNSLNTVFFQIDKQNHLARETLSKFSDMLRYQLYECNGSEISIEKEVHYLKNYVELQRLRRDENYSISFSCADNLKNLSLPPLLLLPFVENAFKHVSHFQDKRNEISISLQREGNIFSMKIFNTKDTKHSSKSGGIGLKNVKRRLELLYKDQHMLDIVEGPERYEVNLALKLHEA